MNQLCEGALPRVAPGHTHGGAVDVAADEHLPDVLRDHAEGAVERRAVASDPRVGRGAEGFAEVGLRVHPPPERLLGEGDLCERAGRTGELMRPLEGSQRGVVAPLLAEFDAFPQEAFDLGVLRVRGARQ